MAYRKGAKNFFAEVDSGVNDEFKKQYRHRGQVKNNAVTAALRVWIALPKEFQAVMMSDPPGDVYHFMTEKFLDAEALKFLLSLPDKARKDLLEAAIQAKQKSVGHG